VVPEEKRICGRYGDVGPERRRYVCSVLLVEISWSRPTNALFSFVCLGVIWAVLVNQLVNYSSVSFGWTLRIIGFMQLALMVAAVLLIQPRFPRGMPREPIKIKTYFTDKRTLLFTLASFTMNLGIYIPYVRRSSSPLVTSHVHAEHSLDLYFDIRLPAWALGTDGLLSCIDPERWSLLRML